MNSKKRKKERKKKRKKEKSYTSEFKNNKNSYIKKNNCFY